LPIFYNCYDWIAGALACQRAHHAKLRRHTLFSLQEAIQHARARAIQSINL